MTVSPVPTLRRATADDQETIRQIVRQAQLDPFNLGWSHFVVAELDGQIVGIGQIRPYPNCPELGSIVTLPGYRGRGIAAQIIERLLADQPGAIYLECASRMTAYYVRFDFEEIRWQDAPMPLRLKAGLGNFMGRLIGFRVAVMKRDGIQ